jgi:D-alanine transaminase
MNTIAFYNGTFMPKDKIAIPLSDRSIFFGDGIYEAAIGRNGKIYLDSYHMQRFFENVQKLDLTLMYTYSELHDILQEVINLNSLDMFFIYFQLTRSGKERRHTYSAEESNLLITISEICPPSPDASLKLITRKDERHELCSIKTLNLLASVIASQSAFINGCDEAVLHKNGFVTECAHSNVHIIKNKRVLTHPTDGKILPGVTRKRIIEICRDLNIAVTERPFTTDELYDADEILVTSSSKLCVRAHAVDDVTFDQSEDSIGYMLCKSIYHDFLNQTK